jgi:hypothetical protein
MAVVNNNNNLLPPSAVSMKQFFYVFETFTLSIHKDCSILDKGRDSLYSTGSSYNNDTTDCPRRLH